LFSSLTASLYFAGWSSLQAVPSLTGSRDSKATADEPASSSFGKKKNQDAQISGTARDWWNRIVLYVKSNAQPFHPPWKNGMMSCLDLPSSKKIHNLNYGLMLTKIHKAASSTSAGVTIRIANRVAKRIGHLQHQECMLVPL
jgi:hypothetical protein